MGILVLKVLGKTAIKLIQSYGSVENVLDHIESLTPGQQKKLQLIKKFDFIQTISGNLYGCAYRYNCII